MWTQKAKKYPQNAAYLTAYLNLYWIVFERFTRAFVCSADEVTMYSVTMLNSI